MVLTVVEGDIVRFSPNKLSFRTTGALHDIYTDRRANVVKSGWTSTGLRINPGITTHVLSDRTLHAARRRLLNQAFSESAMKGLEKYVIERIQEWCGYLGEPKTDSDKDGWSKQRDLGTWSTLLTVDVLGELSFGSSFGAMKAGYSYIMELLLSSARFQTRVSTSMGSSPPWSSIALSPTRCTRIGLTVPPLDSSRSFPFANSSTRS